MIDLSLTFSVDGGVDQHVPVCTETFIIGRYSGCDLTIRDGRLSREHLKIERFDDEYFASDLGSSNGSMLNGAPLSGRVMLYDGDILDLGGGVAIAIRLEERTPEPASAPDRPAETEGSSETAADSAMNAGVVLPVTSDTDPSRLPTSIFFVAPIFGIIVLALVVGFVYVMSDAKRPAVAANEFQYSTADTERQNEKRKDNKQNDTTAPSPSNDLTGSTPDTDVAPAQTPSGEYAAIEKNGTAFLRRISANDSRAFLTGEQAKLVSQRVKQFSGSSALAANIESARRNSSRFASLAKEKNLKPQFLAAAALMKLGTDRGDAYQTAVSMADVLDKLGTQIGSELADDTLLIIAAYDQGTSGQFQKMRNELQELANKYPDSSRQIRTIWFLKEKNQITNSEFERALTFLAIGIITQNPKEFGVNTEALLL